ncbi:OmpA family protein [Flagellimonas allohymeniacidonis]|uniref:OmpA family protein n=1 Tax=Flagellimonas allohymeniacidonis TaxID=2517819 RepID=A0A4Q8QGD4_9FLAO|nr:OmpA family protein [Allomuricauda hymeniacidonis]TAI49622.1 OmpA family protein [Allomuricauda hymeniacidonis]
MKTLYTSTIFLFLFVFGPFANAQCSEIYFYRTNGFQSKRAIVLYQNGTQLATINAGERFKAVTCSTEALEFVVRTSENDMVPSKVNFTPEAGKNYYLKVNCAVGVEIASIKIQDAIKGKRDVNNGNKFISPTKSLSIEGSTDAQTPNPLSSTLVGETNSKSFERTQVIDNFKFEIVDIIKAGEMLTLEYKITNLAADDRRLETCANLIYFYDDLGNLSFAKQVCLANSCSSPPNWIKTLNVPEKYGCHSSVNSNTIMPSGIPLNGKIVIQDINKRAVKFVRGTVWFKSEVSYKVNYANIEFPKVVDPENANKRNFGDQSIELLAASREDNVTYIHFQHSNQNREAYSSKIQSGEVYDNLGNKHIVDGLSLVSKDKRVNYNRYAKGWDFVVAPNGSSDMFAIVDKIPATATQIRRITLTFDGFTLSWDNIDIGGSSSSQPGPEYIPYSEFETKVRNNQDVIGTKVILKNIYFSTGSDEILKNSHPQLNQLADLLILNGGLKVEVSGHTDNVGDDVSNMLLSQKRADAIKYYLIGKSVSPTRVLSIGKGENEPISDNSTDSGKQENRRVEIQVVK